MCLETILHGLQTLRKFFIIKNKTVASFEHNETPQSTWGIHSLTKNVYSGIILNNKNVHIYDFLRFCY